MNRDRANALPDSESRGTKCLEEIVADLLDTLNSGKELDPLDIVERYPDQSEAILDQVYAFLDLGTDAQGAPPLGTLGDYTLRCQIGRGGMGVVYEAWQGSMDRVVALKVLPPGVAADHKAFHRFMREAKTAGQLNHQNVVAVYSTGVEEGTPWYSMEYVEGETLGQVLREVRVAEAGAETPFGTKDEVGYFANLAKAFADVADGLQHAHSKGVIHRDIKPFNLILDGEGRLRILDFGLAHLEGQESLTLSGDVVGTPSYMSPEQARAKKDPIDHRTDVYSLGATMYEALTSNPPFRGKSHQDTLSQIIESDPEEPRKFNPRIPADLETIVLKCLRKDPGNRYGTAEALGQDLRRFVRGDPIEARPQSGLEKLGKRLWVYKGVVTATFLVLLFIIAGLTAATALIARARDEARRDLYVSNMRLALEDWHAGNMSRFRELVDRHHPETGKTDLCGWEWYYLNSLKETGLLTIREHAGPVHSVAWNPAGDRIASGSADGTARVWEADSGEEILRLESGGSAVLSVAWSPEGVQLAAGFGDGQLVVWNAASGDVTLDLVAHDGAFASRSIAWSPDGRWIASSGSQAGLKVFSTDGETEFPLAGKNRGGAIAFSPDGTLLSAVVNDRKDDQVHLFDTSTWERLPIEETRGWHEWVVLSLAWSRPEGRHLATGGHEQKIKLWGADTWELAQELERPGEGAPHALAFSPAGEFLASGSAAGIVTLWPGASHKDPVVLRGHSQRVLSLSFSPDGQRLASAGADGTIRVWDPMGDRASEGSIRLDGESPVAWSPDGRWLAMENSDSLLEVVDTQTLHSAVVLPCGEREDYLQSLAFSPNGRLLSAAARKFEIWDWRAKELVAVLETRAGRNKRLAWSPDGRKLATAATGQRVTIWDTETWEAIQSLPGHRGRFMALSFSPDLDGRYLAAMDAADTVHVWETQTWEQVRELGSAAVSSTSRIFGQALSWHFLNQHLASGNSTGSVTVWNVQTGEAVQDLRGHGPGVTSVSWSPDGSRIASGDDGGTIKIWDAASGDELLSWRGHRWAVFFLFWNPDGKRLLSAGGLRRSVKIWDATAGFSDG